MYKIEGQLHIDRGHLPYPKPVHITKEGKLVNLADAFKAFNGKKVEIIVTVLED